MSKNQGFTVVELLVTLIVSMLLLVSIYQFYNYVLADSAEARARAVASNLAYQYMRERAGQVAATCPATPIVSVITSHASTTNLPAPASPNPAIRITTKCAVNAPTDITQIIAEVMFGNPVTTITHATYVKGQ